MFAKLKNVSMSAQPWLLLAMLVVAGFVGFIIPYYVWAFDGAPSKLLVLPAALVVFGLLCYDRLILLGVILIFRSGMDRFLATTTFSLGSIQLGLGGLINLAIIMVAAMLIFEQPKVLRKSAVTPWIGFLAVSAIGIIFTPEKSDGIRLFLGLLSNLSVFCAAFYFYNYKKTFRTAVTLIFWSSVVPALYALVDIALHGIGHMSGFRLASTFEHPNILAFYLVLVLTVSMYIVKSPAYKLSLLTRSMCWTYMVYLGVLLLLTQTRSAWISCFIMIFLYGVFFQRRYLIYLVALPVLALALPQVRDRLVDLLSGNDSTVQYAKLNSFAWRQNLWESGLGWMDVRHYALGYGIESFKFFSPTFFSYSHGVKWQSHSMIVQWIFEAGAIGFGCLVWLFGKFIAQLRYLTHTDRLAAFVTITVVIEYVTVAASDNLAYYLAFNWYFYFLVGSGCAAAVMVPSKKRNDRMDLNNKFGQADESRLDRNMARFGERKTYL